MTARQYSAGISSLGPGVCTGGTFLPTAAALASLSICFGVGMRQLAGRSVIPQIEHIENKRVESAEGRNPKNDPADGISGVGTKAPRSS
jgi:hypothetical protein